MHIRAVLLLLACCIAGSAWAEEASWQAGDNNEVWARCGPMAGEAKDCLGLARRYATGKQTNAPACARTLGGPEDTQFNNAWMTLRPNGGDPEIEQAWLARRKERVEAALKIASDPGSDLAPAESKLFHDEFTDCWSTYSRQRGLNASDKARDDFLTFMDEVFGE